MVGDEAARLNAIADEWEDIAESLERIEDMTDTTDATPKQSTAKADAAVLAFFNEDASVASFHSRADAQAYADAFGGSVEPSGVAFIVGDKADHAAAVKAKDKAIKDSHASVAAG